MYSYRKKILFCCVNWYVCKDITLFSGFSGIGCSWLIFEWLFWSLKKIYVCSVKLSSVSRETVLLFWKFMTKRLLFVNSSAAKFCYLFFFSQKFLCLWNLKVLSLETVLCEAAHKISPAESITKCTLVFLTARCSHSQDHSVTALYLAFGRWSA